MILHLSMMEGHSWSAGFSWDIGGIPVKDHKDSDEETYYTRRS